MRTCGYCGTSIVWKNAQARYCSDKCRNYDRRRKTRNPIPRELTERNRWVRRTANKMPLTIEGTPASSTNPDTWTTHTEATKSKAGVGLGFVLNGDGISCIDLDHVITNGTIDERAIAFIQAAKPFYTETSPSGDGIHAWTTTPPPGRNIYTLDNGLKVEWYKTGRYLTITGNPITI